MELHQELVCCKQKIQNPEYLQQVSCDVEAFSNHDNPVCTPGDKEYKERIELLEKQLQSIRDELKQDRRDREKTMYDVEQLRKEMQYFLEKIQQPEFVKQVPFADGMDTQNVNKHDKQGRNNKTLEAHDIMLSESQIVAIKENFATVKRDAKPEGLIGSLFSTQTITLPDKQNLNAMVTDDEKMDYLLRKIVLRGSQGCLMQFKLALNEAGQSHIADLLPDVDDIAFGQENIRKLDGLEDKVREVAEREKSIRVKILFTIVKDELPAVIASLRVNEMATYLFSKEVIKDAQMENIIDGKKGEANQARELMYGTLLSADPVTWVPHFFKYLEEDPLSKPLYDLLKRRETEFIDTCKGF